MLSKTFFAFIFLYFFKTEIYTQHILFPEKNLYAAVLIEVPGRFPASGFYFADYNDNLFLVTAKHVLLDSLNNPWSSAYRISCPSRKNPNTLVRLRLNPHILKLNNELLFLDSVDMAVVRIGIDDTTNKKIKLSDGIVNLSQSIDIVTAKPSGLKMYEKNQISTEIFLVGYPSSLAIGNNPQFNYQFPLIRKGIIAGKYDLRKTLIIDSPAYFGNSGGPVFEFLEDRSGFDLKLIGIVTGFIPFDEYWVNRKLIPGALLTNSGYSVVIPVDNLLLLTSKFK